MTHDQIPALPLGADEGLGDDAAAPHAYTTPGDATRQDAAQADAPRPNVAVEDAVHPGGASGDAINADVATENTNHADGVEPDAPHAGVAAAEATHADGGGTDAPGAPNPGAAAAPSEVTAAGAAQSEVSAEDANQPEVAVTDASQPGPASPDAVPSDAAPAEGSAAAQAPGEAAATPGEPDEELLRLAEALVFAFAGPVSPRALTQILPDTADADAVIAALRARYAGRGVELVETAGGVQFRTAPELAPRLRKVIEVPRKLPRVAMETLAIIAYHQPCTRAEVEEIRGTSLSQQTLDALLEANLVAPKGRREVPGRPTLWGTTAQFLVQFGLRDIRDLPQRTDLLLETPQPSGVSDAPPMTPDLSDPPPAPDESSPGR